MIGREFRRAVERIVLRYIPLTTPLTSTSWDGDARSTTTATLLDLSAVFGVPGGIRAVELAVQLRDSGSAGGDYDVTLGPNAALAPGITVYCGGLTNDALTQKVVRVPCDANGDIYYAITASGASTMDVWLRVWGYYI